MEEGRNQPRLLPRNFSLEPRRAVDQPQHRTAASIGFQCNMIGAFLISQTLGVDAKSQVSFGEGEWQLLAAVAETPPENLDGFTAVQLSIGANARRIDDGVCVHRALQEKYLVGIRWHGIAGASRSLPPAGGGKMAKHRRANSAADDPGPNRLAQIPNHFAGPLLRLAPRLVLEECPGPVKPL
jgi:hypothetical protein